MPIARCAWMVPVIAMAGTAVAQAPTLPSDTLHANFAPHFRLAPGTGLAPADPGDTLETPPRPTRPDGALFGEQEDVPIPARIAGARLA
jgi:hypothetical protein